MINQVTFASVMLLKAGSGLMFTKQINTNFSDGYQQILFKSLCKKT